MQPSVGVVELIHFNNDFQHFCHEIRNTYVRILIYTPHLNIKF